MKIYSIIPSGGVGTRFNSNIPKQYIKVFGKELIVYTLEIFQKCNLIDEIIIPASESYFELLNQIKKEYNLTKISKIVKGGQERQDSVYNGLVAAHCKPKDLIVVHDAARPLLSDKILRNAIMEAKKFDSVVVAIKAKDTLFSAKDNVRNYIDRTNIFYAQTPQVFKYDILKEAFELANKNKFKATDESMIVKNANFDVKVIEGDFRNFKITTQSDLSTFEKLVSK
jgi:2-C-methyl-D-erythritol 4-phosphate cytidylyltransferase